VFAHELHTQMASIRKLQNGKWRAQVRHSGVPSQSKVFRTKAMAETWAREQEQAYESGWVTTGAAKRVTLGELFEKYEKEVLPGKKGGNKERSRLRLLEDAFGKVSLAQLSADRVMGYASARLQLVESDTVRRDLSLLSAVVHLARTSWGYSLQTNPVQDAVSALNRQRVLRRKVERSRRLYPGEYKRLLRALHSNETMRKVVRLILETAMRRDEVVRVRPADLRPDGLRITDDKTGKTTTIPVSKKARALVSSLGVDGFGLRGDSITQAFSRACRRAGIEDLRLHDLRREATSRYFEKGLSIPEVQMITRHSGWGSLKVYTRPTSAAVTDKLG